MRPKVPLAQHPGQMLRRVTADGEAFPGISSNLPFPVSNTIADSPLPPSHWCAVPYVW